MENFLASIISFFDSAPKTVWLLMIQGICILSIAIISTLILHYTFKKIHKKFAIKTNPYTNAFLKASHLPLNLLIWFISFFWFLNLLQYSVNLPLLKSVPLAQKIIIILLLMFFLQQSAHHIFQNFKKNYTLQLNTNFSLSTLDFIYKVVQGCILICTLLILTQSIGISITGLLTFSGLGGIILGFAAKDMLANIFSGFMLHMDQPFNIGDRIELSNQISGIVEHIGWRQTRIRNYASQPIYIPNALFANHSITTPSRMLNRRFIHTIGLRYDDFRHLNTILKEIRDYIEKNKNLNHDRPCRVYFLEYGNYSLNIQIYCFTLCTGYDDFLKIQEEILFNVGDIIQKNGADFAFPTQTIDFKKNDHKIDHC